MNVYVLSRTQNKFKVCPRHIDDKGLTVIAIS